MVTLRIGSWWTALVLVAGIGCGSDDAASGSTAASESGDVSGSSTTGASGSESATAGTSDAGSGSEAGSSGSTSGSASEADATGSGAIDCEGRCAEQAACSPVAEQNCLVNCIETQQAADAVGAACGEAYLAFQDCMTQRSCAEIEQEAGCEAEGAVLADSCGALAPAACQAVCPKWVECGLVEPDGAELCPANCALLLGMAELMSGPDCAAAYDALYACEAELSCAELSVDHCPAEVAEGEQACA